MVTDTISPPVEPVKKNCTFIGRAEKRTPSKAHKLLYNRETEKNYNDFAYNENT
jgi:hypothetical protein